MWLSFKASSDNYYALEVTTIKQTEAILQLEMGGTGIRIYLVTTQYPFSSHLD